MEFLSNYGLFLAKTITFVVAIFIVISMIVGASSRGKKSDKGQIRVSNLNEKYEAMRDALQEIVLDESAFKQLEKDEKKRLKAEAAEQKKKAKAEAKQNKEKNKQSAEATENAETSDQAAAKKRVYVLNFNGDIKASANDNLREEITAVLTLARPTDEIVVKLESGGGMVHSYGLASSQLARIKSKKIPLTVCVDKVAASGGYMMACVADKIVAAPFAILGSIGVVAQVPNFNRLLKKHDIDYEIFTAGEYKRTVTMFGENSKKGREKFKEELEDTHELFKSFVNEQRSQVDIEAVATGEVWYGKRALDVKLVDELITSDEYIFNQVTNADIFEVEYAVKKSLTEKLGVAAQQALENTFLKIWEKSQFKLWF